MEFRFTIDDPHDGQRLDKVLIDALGHKLGRAKARALFEMGAVRVSGHVVPKGRVARRGELVTVDLPEDDSDAALVADGDAPLDVRLEREDLVVVCKPAGMPTVPLRAAEMGTLANALAAHYPEMVGVGRASRELGLLHRLDSGTSGLLVAARIKSVFEHLAAALRDGKMHKSYLLVCEASGLAPSGVIEFPLCSHPKDARRVLACVHPRDVQRYRPRAASTSYRIIEASGPLALVEAAAARAGRHQLRAHFAAVGHPLVGDVLYGGDDARLSHQALHAYHVSFQGSATVPAFDVQASLPADLRALLDGARG